MYPEVLFIDLVKRLRWKPRREERAPFIAVNLIGNGLGYLLLRALNAPASLSALMLVYVALGVTMLTIYTFWKISLHACCVGGFAAACIASIPPQAVAASRLP
jgi:hypothetical protein